MILRPTRGFIQHFNMLLFGGLMCVVGSSCQSNPDPAAQATSEAVLESLKKNYTSACKQTHSTLEVVLSQHLNPKIDASYKATAMSMGLKMLMQIEAAASQKQSLSFLDLAKPELLEARRNFVGSEEAKAYLDDLEDCDLEAAMDRIPAAKLLRKPKDPKKRLMARLLLYSLISIDGQFSYYSAESVKEKEAATGFGIDLSYLSSLQDATIPHLWIEQIWNEKFTQNQASTPKLALTELKLEGSEQKSPWLPVGKFFERFELEDYADLDYFLNFAQAPKSQLFIRGFDGKREAFETLLPAQPRNKKERPQIWVHNISQDALYLRLHSFEEEQSAKQMLRVLEETDSPDKDKLILDLRGNLGGSFAEVQRVLSLFLSEAALSFFLFNPKGAENAKHLHAFPAPSVPNPLNEKIWNLAVLVDHKSASGAELLAAALSHYQKALVLASEETYGKFVSGVSVDLGKPLGGSVSFINNYVLMPDFFSHQNKSQFIDVLIPDPYSPDKNTVSRMPDDLRKYHYFKGPSIPNPNDVFDFSELDLDEALQGNDEPAWISKELRAAFVKNLPASAPVCAKPKDTSSPSLYYMNCMLDTAVLYLEELQELRNRF